MTETRESVKPMDAPQINACLHCILDHCVDYSAHEGRFD